MVRTPTTPRRPPRAALTGLALALVLAVAAPAAAQDATSTTTSTSTTTVPGAPAPDGSTTTTAPLGPDTSIPDLGAHDLPGQGTPGDTAPPPPAGPVVDPSPHVRAALATLVVQRSQQDLALAQLALGDAQATQAQVDAARDAAQRALDAANAAVDAARTDLGDAAVLSFVHANGSVTAATESIDEYGQRKGEQLSRSVLEHKMTVVAQRRQQAGDAEQALADRQGASDEAANETATRQQAVDAAQSRLDAAREEERQAIAADDPRIFDPNAGVDQSVWQLSIMGESVLTADELAGWFHDRGGLSRAQAPIEELAQLYIDEGATEGVRGDVAFAQAVLETGGFTNDDTVRFNNYAGVGHCDSCGSGFAFATPQDGVRGQIQLLKDYVMVDPPLANPLVDPRLHGPSGCCQMWVDLGGVWASTRNYGPLVLAMYQSMLDWALPRRSGTPLPQQPGG